MSGRVPIAAVLPLAGVFPLPVFPESGLDRSIITTVFVGLVVMVFFSETLGWVFSGLVVPGYLAPIFLINPWSACVIVVEALLTHGLVRFASDVASKIGRGGYGPWRRFFGRDRFFAYLAFGVLVRAVGEGYLFHEVGAALNKTFGLSIDYRNNFYSVGLIVVPLLANMFWKPGVRGGLLPVAAAVAVTYAIIRWVLVPYTNFSIGSFELSYGYYAMSFVGNAKAYIVLLTTAFLASRANLRYGWDYNGILIPSLLALTWFEWPPTKLFTSLVEAVVILYLARWVAARKFLSAVTIEGGRRLLLCFAVGYAVKMAVGFFVRWRYPGFDAGELYGFGYLLPSLIANKMHQKNSVALVLRPLVQTSLAGAVAGALVAGLLLQFLPVAGPFGTLDPDGERAPAPLEVRTIEADVYGTVLADKARLVRRDDRKGADRASGRDLELFREAVRLLREAQRHPPDSPLAEERVRDAAARLRPLGYRVDRLREPEGQRALHYYVREVADAPGALHGWGIYVFAAAPRSDLVVEVPRPFAEWKAIECGAALYERLGARALLIAGAHPLASRSGVADVLAAPGSIFQAAHALHARDQILQVRGETDAETAARAAATDPAPPLPGAPPARLFYEREIPEDLRLRELEAAIGAPPVLVLPGEGRHERSNLQRETAARSFAILALSAEGARRTIGQRLTGQRVETAADVRNIDGYLLTWIEESKPAIAASGSEAYVPPTAAELIYMDEEVLAPAVRIALASGEGSEPPADDVALRHIARAADALGYELIRYTYAYGGSRFLILRERDGPGRRYRGTFIFRLGHARPYAIEVPYPVTEYHTFEAGARLFEFLDARALVLAGASRLANADGSADVASPRHIGSFFQLAHQALVRESAGALLAVQVRGFSSQAGAPGLDAVLSTGREVKRRADLPPLVLRLEDDLRRLDARVGIFDGSLATLRFQGGRSAQWAYCDVHAPGSFVYLFLSSAFRQAFRNRLPEREEEASLPPIGIESRRGNLIAFVEAALAERRRLGLARPRGAETSPRAGAPEPAALDEERRTARAREAIEKLRSYARSRNVLHLVGAKAATDAAGAALVHFLDVSANREVLVFAPPDLASAADFREPGRVASARAPREALLLVNLHSARAEEAEIPIGRPDLLRALADVLSRGFETVAIAAPDREGGP